MAQIVDRIQIRPLQDDDFEGTTAIARANFPDEPRTAGEARDKYQRFDSTRFAREWIVATDAREIVGYGFYSHVPWSFHPDKYQVYAAVHPRLHRQGIGTRLMRVLLDRAGSRGATRLRSWAREDYPHAVAFLAGFGFAEHGRTFESRLQVAAVDVAHFAHYYARAQEAGVVITTLGEELARDPHCLPAVYQAHGVLEISTPHQDPDLPTPPSYERFLQNEVHHPRVLLDGFFLAKVGDFYIGESALKRTDADPAFLWQQLTAVVPEYRGHGIASALKLHTIAYAQQRGYREIRTFNSSRNGPMLAINTKFGFIRQPAWIDFLRSVRA